MKKLLLLSLALIVMQLTFGQLTGTKTIPGDYATIEAAIAALNSQGVGSGGVTFNVAAGHTETLSTTTAGTITTNTGTSSNQIIFQKSGAGANPVITAAVIATASATDGIIKIAGTDYVTFDAINLQENAGNTTNLTDWGYAVLKESAANGSQNITIKNCTITLNKVNTSSVGIYMHNHTATSTTALTGITSLAGTNSYNKIFNNTISNAYNAIYISGFNDVAPYAYYDQNNEIGVSGGNMISDFGGAATTIYGIYTIYQNNQQVSNNMLTGTIGGTTTVYGIYISTAVNANATVSGNSLTFTFSGTTQTLYGIYNAAGGTGTNNTINFTGNTVSLNYSSATTGSMYAFYQSASCYNFNCSNNNVTNNVIGSASTVGTGTFGGLYTFGTNSNAGSLWNINNNNITGNMRAQSAAGAGTNYYLYNSSSGVTCNINNNILTNNTATSTGTTYCIYTSSSATTKNIFDNEVSNLLNSSGTVYGIYSSSGTTISIYRNKVLNLNSNVAAGIVHGIYVGSGTNGYVFNNFVSELKTPVATGNPAIYGLNIAGGTNMYAYYNTVYLNATSTGASFGSAGLYASTTPIVDLRNNVVVNVSIPGATGRTVAYQRSSSTLTTYSNVSNNNDFYAGTPGASNLIYYDVTNSDQTLAAYKARVSPRDASTVSENPPFVNVTSAPYNLHIQTTLNTQLESGGTIVSTPISVVDDYDVQARYPNAGYPNNAGSPATAPDIGADEFGGLALDMTPPNIAFTPFVNTSGTGARTLTTTITDATGVPVSGAGLPVLYWKINSGAYTPVTATYVSGSTYTFTFGAGVVLGDVVSYYIVAQDLVTPTPNVGANPSGGASGYTVNPPACSTPPTTPYSYTIVGALCGNYNVGAGQAYTTLTAAVADLNLKEITCPVTLTLTDANYSAGETFPLVINAMAGASAVNTVTIKPAAGVSPLITGNSATSIFKFNGTQYLTIDGSNSGGSTRNLTITNTAASGTTAVVWIGSLGSGQGAMNCAVKNCIISNGFNTSGAYGIFIGAASAIGTNGNDLHNITISNNEVYKAYYGIYSGGVSTGIFNNLIINNNKIGSALSTDYVGYYGIFLSGANAPMVKGNEVYNMITTTLSLNIAGIQLNADLTNPVIEANTIHDIQNNNSGGWGAYGINVAAATVSGATIVNNLIYNITTINYSSTSTTYNPFGIRLVAGAGHKVQFNTIHLTGVQFNSGTTASLTACLLLTASSVTGLEVRDNIFSNNLEGVAGTKSYAVYAPTGTVFGTINYNDYYAYGTYGVLGFLGADMATLPAWQAATGQDASSVSIIPSFDAGFMPTNLALDNLGLYLASVPGDLDGHLRTNPADMGALEFGINPEVYTNAATLVNCGGATLNGSIMANGLTVNTYFDYGPTTAYGSSVAGTPASISGTTSTAFSATLSLPPVTTYHFRARGVTTAGVHVFGPDMMFTTTATGAPEATTLAATGIGPNGATLNAQVNALCAATTVTFEYGETTSYGSSINATPNVVNGGLVTAVNAALSGLVINTTYHFRVKAVSTNGTTYGSDLTFTTGGMPPTVTTVAASNIGNFTARLNGTVNANDQSSTVSFEYGLTTAYGTTLAGVPGTVTGNTATAVYADISGLNYNTVYHFRCVAANIGGTTYGNDMTFTTLCPLPEAAGTISGPVSVCQNTTGHVYSVPAIQYATGYYWTLPAGGIITAGDNTNSITVNYLNTAVSGDVAVYGTSTCGNGTASTLAVTVNALPVPTITGPTTACITNTYTYSTQAGMTGYVWAVSAGGQIMTGAGTNTVTIKWNSAGAQWVSVTYTSAAGCPAASPTTVNVSVGTLPSPSIAGSDKTCVNSGYGVYTTQTGYTGYTWTVSTGGTIVSGQGTYQVEVDWTSPGTKTVSVNYATAYGCFAATPASFTVIVTPPPPPAGPVSGSHDVCAGELGVDYSVAPIPDAANYVWTLPAGATIMEGEGTNQIKVDFAANAQSGNVSVYAENICGAGQASPPFALSVNPVPPTPVASVDENFILHSTALIGNQWYLDGAPIDGATDPDYQAESEGVYYTIVTIDGCSSEPSNEVDVIFTGIGEPNGSGFSIFPIPNNGKFTATMVIQGEDTFTIRVFNELGGKVYEKSGIYVNGKAQEFIELNNPAKGIYSVIFQGNNQTVTRKVLVTR